MFQLSGGERILYLSVSLYAATLIDKVGRRPLFLTATAGMAVSFVCWTITSAIYENSNSTNKAAGYVQIPIIWIFGIFYSLAWSGLLVAYALEILPYRLRAKGLMIMNITVQAILAIGGQTNPMAWEDLPKHWNFTLFYTVSQPPHIYQHSILITSQIWICLELIWVYFVYPETKGPTLEEISRIFDGSDAVAHVDIAAIEKDVHEDRLDNIHDDKNPRVEQTRV